MMIPTITKTAITTTIIDDDDNVNNTDDRQKIIDQSL